MARSVAREPLRCMEVRGGNRTADVALEMPGLEAVIACRPSGGAVGGDLHYVSSCATGRISRVLLADVSGHGPQVAALSEELRRIMRRYLNHLDPGRLMDALNREVGRLVGESGFATALVATYFAPTDSLLFSNAGHPPPLFRRAGGALWTVLGRRASTEEGMNTPLGVSEPGTFDRQEVRLGPGDQVLFYTDAVIEAEDPAGRRLGERGLLALLDRVDPRRPEEVLPALLDGIDAHRGGAAPSDDLTLILLAGSARKPGGWALRGLKAGGRILRAFLGAVLGSREPVPWPEATLVSLGGPFLGRFHRRWAAGAARMGQLAAEGGEGFDGEVSGRPVEEPEEMKNR